MKKIIYAALITFCLTQFAYGYGDRVGETTTTTGTGTISLAGAKTGYVTFNSIYDSTDTVSYLIQTSDGTQWEIGKGTFTDAATDTISRDTVEASSNSGAKVVFSAGTKSVYNIVSATDFNSFGSGSGYTNLTDFDAQTAWRIFYSNGDGDTTELALGADGTYLKSNGASAAPTWAASSSGLAETDIDASSELAAIMDDETGTGYLCFNTSPTILTPSVSDKAYEPSGTGDKTPTLAELRRGTITNKNIGAALDIVLDDEDEYITTKILIVDTTYAISLVPPSGECLRMDGTFLDANDEIDLTKAEGDKFILTRMYSEAKTDYIWDLETVRGTASDGGAGD